MQHVEQPGVTVVVPVYKGGALVRATIDSLLAQTYPALRILVVCDGSPDPSDHALAQDYAGRIDFVAQANQGLCATLNAAIFDRVDTPLVARIDQDDLAHPDRIQAQVDALLAQHADACFCKVNKFVRAGRVLAVHPAVDAAVFDYDPLAHGAIVHSTLLARTEFLRQLGAYRAELYPCDDYDLNLRMSRAGRVVVLGRALVDYRIHDQANTFAQFWAMQSRSDYLVWAHQTGQHAVTYAEWFDREGRSRAASWPARIDGLGRLLYRRAGVRIGGGRVLSGGLFLLASALLTPGFSLGRLRNALRTVWRRRA